MNGYDEAIGVDATDAVHFFNRGLAYAGRREYEAAIQDYDQAIRLNPRFAEAFAARGAAYGDAGQYDRAVQDLDQAVGLNPNLAKALASAARLTFSRAYTTAPSRTSTRPSGLIRMTWMP